MRAPPVRRCAPSAETGSGGGATALSRREPRLQRAVARPRAAVDAEDATVPARALRHAAPLVEVPARDLAPVLPHELERVGDRPRGPRLVVLPGAAERDPAGRLGDPDLAGELLHQRGEVAVRAAVEVAVAVDRPPPNPAAAGLLERRQPALARSGLKVEVDRAGYGRAGKRGAHEPPVPRREIGPARGRRRRRVGCDVWLPWFHGENPRPSG